MPGVDDQPTDLSPETEPDPVESTPADAESAPIDAESTPADAEPTGPDGGCRRVRTASRTPVGLGR